ncbi:hypothetical protein LOD44_11505 [Xylella fastidiosa subsp. multiplex]|uniref:hypothetical protein n=1 Tax=Xylella fastidiosa TaxID=2371 RepID=UPI000056F642|nr:hypothetical protein [Xylella fastidiosa]KAJ4851779.1 hypothetical protein XYFPCFBP8418_007625 [Xylella fastidiosa subsp. multiplex]MDC6412051.1 hypothetical protein [Xylella fastidiosa subsp. multiplex]MDC6415409.1 hypothetical protein [Xylella fastidiosa subsp. multiplex]MDC6416926.1 hypothetical protein [Xylella fastidiosa subsp. multiplex]MDD0862234.1 hypothetical protein [Xylella fastidiosa subsp. multiplex]
MTMTQKEDKTEIINEREAQIAKILTETSKLNAETAKIQAEIHEVNAQTKKLTAESKWYPVVVASSLIAAGATAATLFIKLFH